MGMHPGWLEIAEQRGMIKKPVVSAPPLDCAEKQLQVSVIALAKSFGWIVYHTNDSRRSEKGFPDLVLVRCKRTVFAELKTAAGKLTPEQQVWIEALKAAGQEVYAWRPNAWETIVAILRPESTNWKKEQPQ